jgi:hypothetical protein
VAARDKTSDLSSHLFFEAHTPVDDYLDLARYPTSLPTSPLSRTVKYEQKN